MKNCVFLTLSLLHSFTGVLILILEMTLIIEHYLILLHFFKISFKIELTVI